MLVKINAIFNNITLNNSSALLVVQVMLLIFIHVREYALFRYFIIHVRSLFILSTCLRIIIIRSLCDA